MGLSVFGEDLLNFLVKRLAVGFAGGLNHANAAKRHDGSLKRSISLKAYDLLKILVDVSGLVGGDGRGSIGIEIQRSVSSVLLLDAFHYLIPQSGGCIGRTFKEGIIPFIRSVILLDKITGID